MTPGQKIKATIMLHCQKFIESLDDGMTVDVANVDKLWRSYREDEDGAGGEWCSQDEIEEFRGSGLATDLTSKDFSRHYESYEVAAKMFDDTYVGWTFWHGGGKHGEPSAIDWMTDAYDVDHTAEERLVVVHSFVRKSP